MPNFVLKNMEHAVCKEVNNIRYLYKENGYRSWKRFAIRCGINPVTLSKYNWEEVIPSPETLSKIAKAFNVSEDYFAQERPLLTLEKLIYGHHHEHHSQKKFSLDEFYDAYSMVAEEPHLDYDAFERVLNEHHH